MVYTFEIVGLIFTVTMIYFTYLDYKRKRLGKKTFVFWALVWIFGTLLILFHDYVNSLIPNLNIMRVLDLYMILAFMFLFAVAFYLFRIVKNIEGRVEDIARKFALEPINHLIKTKK